MANDCPKGCPLERHHSLRREAGENVQHPHPFNIRWLYGDDHPWVSDFKRSAGKVYFYGPARFGPQGVRLATLAGISGVLILVAIGMF